MSAAKHSTGVLDTEAELKFAPAPRPHTQVPGYLVAQDAPESWRWIDGATHDMGMFELAGDELENEFERLDGGAAPVRAQSHVNGYKEGK